MEISSIYLILIYEVEIQFIIIVQESFNNDNLSYKAICRMSVCLFVGFPPPVKWLNQLISNFHGRFSLGCRWSLARKTMFNCMQLFTKNHFDYHHTRDIYLSPSNVCYFCGKVAQSMVMEEKVAGLSLTLWGYHMSLHFSVVAKPVYCKKKLIQKV